MRPTAPCLVALLLLPARICALEPPALSRIDSLCLAGQADSALVEIDRALAGVPGDSALTLALRIRQGELLTSLGHAQAGERILHQALASAWGQCDSASALAALRWLSVAVGTQGRADESADLYTRLLSLARARQDRQHEAWALVGLSWDARERGRVQEGAEEAQEAAEIFRQCGDSRAEAWARNLLGTCQGAMARFEEARRSYRAAHRLARQTGYRMVECLSVNNLGVLEYALGDPGEAASCFRQALRLHAEIGNIRESIVPGINIALCERDLGNPAAASDSLQRMLAVCRRERYRDMEARVLNQLAATRGVQGRRAESRFLYRAALALGPDVPLKSKVEAAIGLAESMAEADSCQPALELLDRTFASCAGTEDFERRLQLEEALGRLLLRSGRAGAAIALLQGAQADADRLGFADYSLRMLVSLGRAWTLLGRPDRARAELELARGIWEGRRGLPSDPEWREVCGATGRMLCTDLTTLVLGQDSTEQTRWKAYALAQGFKARTLLERMRGPFQEGSPPPVLTRDRLQNEVLSEGELLLDYFLGPTRSVLFAINRDTCRVVILPPEEVIDPAAQLYHALLARPPGEAVARDGEGGIVYRADPNASALAAALSAAGDTLASSLLRNVRDLILGSRRIIVAPDGALNLLPFTTLWHDSRPEWIRIPSAAVLAEVRSVERRAGSMAGIPPEILVVTDAGRASPGLPGAATESADLRRRYRRTRLQRLVPGDSVRLGDLSSPVDILHVASHAQTDDAHPWLSTLRPGCRFLRAGEIARTRIPVRLATLSSCRTAGGRILSGEGVLGLSSALLSAGAECIVASLWPVDDLSTARLMRAFYAGLSSGESVADALLHAQSALREDPRTAHPFFWAGFVPIGAGEARIPIVRRNDRRWALCLYAAGICLLILAAMRVRKRDSVTRRKDLHLMG